MAELALDVENVLFENQNPHSVDSKAELLQGLQKTPKIINPKYFYDTRGSELFECITELDEYYPSRTERKILRECASEIADYCGRGTVLIEPGSGSSEKVRLLLNELRPTSYVPMDIAAEFLQRSALKLGQEFPWLNVQAVCADFADAKLSQLNLPDEKRIVFYPGSTIGNMEPGQAQQFLKSLHQWVNDDGGLLIGVDLHKESSVLNAAYNDAKGVTADFNLNILHNINNLLGASFNTDYFQHHAFYNEQLQRIEMHLKSTEDHIVSVADTAIAIAKDETIHTENSYKYTVDGFIALARKAGFMSKKVWLDERALFSVHYLERAI